MNLTSEALSKYNLTEALIVAALCFPKKEDQEFLQEHWERVIENRESYFCEYDQAHLTLLDHYCFRIEGEVVGFGGLYQHDDSPEKKWLNWLGVHPQQQRRGIGESIVKKLAESAKIQGASTLVGYTSALAENQAIRSFYERIGFEMMHPFKFKGSGVIRFGLPLTE